MSLRPPVMCLSFMPVELLFEILSFALNGHPHPSYVLCVDKSFAELGQRILHSHLRFRSVRQLTLFANYSTRLSCVPKAISITLSGGTAGFDVFLHLAVTLRRCRALLAAKQERQQQGAPIQVPLDLLYLRLHSHTRNPNLQYIYEALALANLKTFVWMGPDPDHHFSTAIVPAATFHLFNAIRTWDRIAHITLTNLSFPADELGLHEPLALLPAIPTLRTLDLAQVTLLTPRAVAAMVCPSTEHLVRVRLVDAYSESIWGPRIRRRDVERAAATLAKAQGAQEDFAVAQVRRVVRCEARTERIMGGDRVEGTFILD